MAKTNAVSEKAEGFKTLNVHLPVRLADRLEEYCAGSKKNKSEFVRKAIVKALVRKGA